MVTVPARLYIVIPAALRRRCGLRAGGHVLLAAVSQRTAVEAALVLLERMGLSPADLVVAPRGRTSLMSPECQRYLSWVRGVREIVCDANR
jgi:bifunctional DNA-binding transcriptional regulator/antitoxin component of YhaV-PrlF toxin-antitoxin module